MQQHLGRLAGVAKVEVNLAGGKVAIFPREDSNLDPAVILKATYDSGVSVVEMIILASGWLALNPAQNLVFKISGEQVYEVVPNEVSRPYASFSGTDLAVSVRGRVYRKPEGTGPRQPQTQPLKIEILEASGKTAEGERFPSFTLKDLSGRNVSSAQFRGKTLLIDFWASWCEPCKREMPVFQELQRQYSERGLVVIGVALDENPKTSAKFAKDLGVNYTLLTHPTLMFNEAEQKKFGVIGLPTTFVIDRDGVIRKKVVGFEYKEAFEALLRQLLGN